MGRTQSKVERQSMAFHAGRAAIEVLESRRLMSTAPLSNGDDPGIGAPTMWVFGQIATGAVPFMPETTPEVTPATPTPAPVPIPVTPQSPAPQLTPTRTPTPTPSPTPTQASNSSLRNLSDPAITSAAVGYKNFADRPLFDEDGPTADDIHQGAAADCYLMSVLSSVAKVKPQLIEELITDGGDGTFTVHFTRNNKTVNVTVDADLPVTAIGKTAYAQIGLDGPIWVAIVEKAYANFRTGQNSYASLNLGWMEEIYNALGVASQSSFSSSSVRTLMENVDAALDAGKSVTYGTRAAAPGSNLASGHAYDVEFVERDEDGVPISVRLHNPWAFDGYMVEDGVNDGYLTVSADAFFSSMVGYVHSAL